MLRKEHKILKGLFKLLYTIVISFVCIISIILIATSISSQLHKNDKDYKPIISLYTIVSQSMTPVINVYDVVVNVKVSNPANIHLGDIITYISTSSSSEGMTITHRVVEIKRNDDGTYEYKTQGDNNSNPDSLYVKYDKVIGKEILIIPKLGKIQFYLINKRSWLYLLLIPIIFFIIKDLFSLVDLVLLKKKVDNVTYEEEEQISKTKQMDLKHQLEEQLPKLKGDKVIKPTIINTSVEVLDTDELTSKIKEYNDKIEELNKTIKQYTKEEPVEEITFLKESKIKVINIEETKNKKKTNKETKKVISSPPVEKTPKKEKKQLNLNKNKITKVTRNKNTNKNKNRKLKLNPNNIKQINRPNKKKTYKAKQEFSKPRKKFVEVKKIK